jgi:beta-ureidopropionase / N-carbamoyl-L-amino-acid hydrolase
MTTNVRVNAGRLWSSLMEMAAIGATAKGGVRRIGLTDEDRQGRDLFRRWCDRQGYAVRIDPCGNMFARRAGTESGLAPVMIGSHLDSQPTGGKFDGAFGVLAALEAMRTLDDLGVTTRRPIEIVNWTNEEGAVFRPMLGSEVFTGALPLDTAYQLRDPAGETLESRLTAIGYRGERALDPNDVHCYFEAHIEQGPILEIERKTIGVVTGGIGLMWYKIKIVGVEAHAGPTPMNVRRDALMGAAEVALAVREIARARSGGRGTVGCLTPYPSSPNVIPGIVEMTVDLRHENAAELTRMDSAFRAVVATVGQENKLASEVDLTVESPPIPFNPVLVGFVRDAAESLGFSHLDIVSGAGHDAFHMARRVPTAMVFIPCENGISHNESENATQFDCEAGCNVLLQAALRAANEASEL